jgi:hypothetical protein
MMRVLVRPCYRDFLENRLFEPKHQHATHWMAPFVQLRESARARGWEISTWDMHPLDTADVILFQDLPSRRQEVADAKEAAPRAKFVLQLVESPLSRPHYFLKQNHDLFDAILTYCPQLCDNRRYFRYFLPIGCPPANAPDPPFAERKPLVMINSNRWLGLLAFRQPGLAGLPFVGPIFSGWKISAGQLLRQNQGELYSHRRRIARTADRMNFDGLDVFGSGWRGEPASWVHRFIRHRPFKCGRGTFNGDKLELLPRYRFAVAFENLRANVGYVSEKLFDPLYAGVVPIYLGDQSITDVAPADCFVDARQFKSDVELLAFATNCSESQWRRLRQAGQDFISSQQIRRFQPEAFADTVMEILCRLGGGA